MARVLWFMSLVVAFLLPGGSARAQQGNPWSDLAYESKGIYLDFQAIRPSAEIQCIGVEGQDATYCADLWDRVEEAAYELWRWSSKLEDGWWQGAGPGVQKHRLEQARENWALLRVWSDIAHEPSFVSPQGIAALMDGADWSLVGALVRRAIPAFFNCDGTGFQPPASSVTPPGWAGVSSGLEACEAYVTGLAEAAYELEEGASATCTHVEYLYEELNLIFSHPLMSSLSVQHDLPELYDAYWFCTGTN